MRLQKPFCRLPVRFDAQRLRDELQAAPAAAWHDHPDDYPGNQALRLITAGGTENDDVAGEMQPTPHLAHFPYLQQVLGSFGVVWSRSRLMRLGARATVPLHCDIKYHWHHRVRVHIPIVTNPGVTFTCGGETVHMAAGEAWIFDNWRPHSVSNDSDEPRIHLVADTMGNERFWHLANRGQWANFSASPPQPIGLDSGAATPLLTERFNLSVVMPPAELESLIDGLCADLPLDAHTGEARALIVQVIMLLKGFCSEWRQLWSLAADQPAGWPHYAELRKQLRGRLQRQKVPVPLRLRSNGALFMDALQQGILRHLLNGPASAADPHAGRPEAAAGAVSRRRIRVKRPVIIVAAPRSGSTLLFETLAQSPQLYTLGGEAHHLVEQFAALNPAGGVDSNRLTEVHLTPDIAQTIHETIAQQLRGSNGQAPSPDRPLRMLEKTPKNALRIPFFKALFPDALFLFLWRDPAENLSSIMEAWRSGRFVTYPSLDGGERPWSLLLPPGWQQQREAPLEEIAAFQWRVTNEIILSDLAALPSSDWSALRYSDLLEQPEREVRRVCEFAGLEFDEALRLRTAAPLPESRHTLTAPEADKWRKNGTELERVLAALEPVHARLAALTKSA